MDLRKGSGLDDGERRCIRCRGRKKLYKAMSGWSFHNSGGTQVDCPMCLGKGKIPIIPPSHLLDSKEKPDAKKTRSKNSRKKVSDKKEYEKEY